MNLWTIIPVKSLHQSKSRLAAVLSLKERAELTLSILARTLRLLQTVPAITMTAVITQDPIVANQAAAFGCRWSAEPAGSGLNGAAHGGVDLAAANGATHCLILPSDLPFLTSKEINIMVQLAETAVTHPALILCSDIKKQGTNGMILPIGLGFRFGYGQNSFQNHQREAVRLGLACHIVQLPGLQFDLDSKEDYNAYTKMRVPLPI